MYRFWIAWIQGHYTFALAVERQGYDAAVAVGHPHVTGMFMLGRILHQALRQEHAACCAEAAKLIDFALEHEFPDWLGQARVFMGWASAMAGDAEGLILCRESIRQLGEGRMFIHHTFFLSLLVEALIVHGETHSAQTVLAEAEALSVRGGDHYCEAELARLHGELATEMARAGGASWTNVVAHFEHALVTAERQGALSFALRAARGLARALDAQGRRDEAWQRLHAVVVRFAVSDDSGELTEARALLAERVKH